MLTARDRVEDRIAGLHAGADDYLGKPFSVRELTARLHALSRRASFDQPNVLRVGEIELDPRTREARRGIVTVPLSSREFDLLAELMPRPVRPGRGSHQLDASVDKAASTTTTTSSPRETR
jgi:DNA-binding response OmpR family regulator